MIFRSKQVKNIFASLFSVIITLLVCLLDINFGISWCFIYWLYLLDVYRRSDNLIGYLYLFLFGIFFVLTVIILGGQKFLEYGTFLLNISLNLDESKLFIIVICVFLSAFHISGLFSNQLAFRDHNSILIRSRSIYSLLFLSFVWVISFNIVEAVAVYREGYLAFFSGELSVKKGVLTLFFEQIFLATAIILLSLKKRAAVILLVLYALSILASGQRMPSLFFIVCVLLYYRINNQKRTPIVLASVLGFFIFVPLLMWVQDLRSSQLGAGLSLDFARYYIDVWNVIGFSSDTLKAAITYDNSYSLDMSIFQGIYKWVEVIGGRLFNFDVGANSVGFGSAFTEALDPALYALGITFASSSIAESYFYAGIFGVIFYGVFLNILSRLGTSAIYSSNIYILAAYVIFVPKIFVAVRNELFGWFFLGVIYYLILLPFLFFGKRLFMVRKSPQISFSSTNLSKMDNFF